MMVEDTFVEAARRGRMVRLVERGGGVREAEPYMVFTTREGKRRLHFYQHRGHSQGGEPRGWKMADVTRFRSAEVLEEGFTVREDYNPLNEKLFPAVVFALPTKDGRTRSGAAGREQ